MLICLTAALAGAQPSHAQRLGFKEGDSEFLVPAVAIYPRTARDFSGVVWGYSLEAGNIWGPSLNQEPVTLASLLAPGRAQDIHARYQAASGAQPSGVVCAPFTLAMTANSLRRGLRLLVSDETVVIQQDEQVRVVYMNQDHPEVLKPRWLGHSVGRWDGDTLVVDTVGYNELSMVGAPGIFHTEALRTTERYSLVHGEQLKIEYVIEDARAFVQPYTFVRIALPRLNQGVFPDPGLKFPTAGLAVPKLSANLRTNQRPVPLEDPCTVVGETGGARSNPDTEPLG